MVSLGLNLDMLKSTISEMWGNPGDITHMCQAFESGYALICISLVRDSRLIMPESSPCQGRAMPQGRLFKGFVIFSRDS